MLVYSPKKDTYLGNIAESILVKMAFIRLIYQFFSGEPTMLHIADTLKHRCKIFSVFFCFTLFMFAAQQSMASPNYEEDEEEYRVKISLDFGGNFNERGFHFEPTFEVRIIDRLWVGVGVPILFALRDLSEKDKAYSFLADSAYVSATDLAMFAGYKFFQHDIFTIHGTLGISRRWILRYVNTVPEATGEYSCVTNTTGGSGFYYTETDCGEVEKRNVIYSHKREVRTGINANIIVGLNIVYLKYGLHLYPKMNIHKKVNNTLSIGIRLPI